jgi:hypothetical protein
VPLRGPIPEKDRQPGRTAYPSRRPARQGAGNLRRGDDGRLLRDDSVEQHRMHLCIWVGAAIADDDQPIIQIAGVADGRQHNAAGVDTGEHQRVDAISAQQRLQVGANERADPA